MTKHQAAQNGTSYKEKLKSAIDRLNKENRRRTRVVDCFPDGNSALMLVCARLSHVAGTQWGKRNT